MSKKLNSRRKNVTEGGVDKNDEHLVTIQKTMEIAASEVAHHTQDNRIKHLKKRKVISNLQRTDALQKSQLTWCCRPEPRCATTKSMGLKTQL